MMRLRLAAGLATLGLLIGVGMALKGPDGAASTMAAASAGRSAVLEVFYTPPVLVQAGERVRVPVDVVCATRTGSPCRATVEIGSRVGSEGWRRTTVDAVKGLQFDLSAPATRAVGSGSSSGRVDFYLRARDGVGQTTSIGSERAPLAFFVVRTLPVVRVPAVPFGRVRAGRTVLSLPWGSGPMKAGLQPGIESPTLGPSSFDVDAAGRIVVSDPLQGRVATFTGGALANETLVSLSHKADVAVGAAGETFVADGVDGALTVRTIDRGGRLLSSAPLGQGLSFHLSGGPGPAALEVLPAGQFVDVSKGPGSPGVGMPLRDGSRLVRLGTEHGVRLGIVRDGAVVDALEIRSTVGFGEVALCRGDGTGGFVVVVHTWRKLPTPADQYQVIHVARGTILDDFAVANATYAETPPLSRFRLGPDGALYQMVTTSSSMDIVRFEVRGER